MAIKTSVKAQAAAEDKRMTLDELREFVAECERAEVPGDSWLKAVNSFSGRMKSIEAERR